MGMKCPACEFENVTGTENCGSCGMDLMDSGHPEPEGVMQERILTTPIRDLEPDRALTVSLEATAADAVKAMKKHRHGSVLVLEGSSLRGIFTERDLLSRVLTEEKDPVKTPIVEVMTADPTTLREEDPLAWAIHLMAVRDFRHIPIIRDDASLGVVSIRGVLGYLTRQAL